MPVLASRALLVALCAVSCSKKAKSGHEEGNTTESTAQAPAAKVEATPVTYDLSTEQASLIFDSPLQTLQGQDTTLASMRGKLLLVVNVASECGLTPQYEELQAVHEEYEGRGFSVVGFPCNQFGEQEPGTPEEILAFGKKEFGVTFPLMQKVQTNGDSRHPIYQALTQIQDAKGEAGDVQWNFEKFLISADGKQVTRFRPETTPRDPQLLALLQASLP